MKGLLLLLANFVAIASAPSQAQSPTIDSARWNIREAQADCVAYLRVSADVRLAVMSLRGRDEVHFTVSDQDWSWVEDERRYSAHLRFLPVREDRVLEAVGWSVEIDDRRVPAVRFAPQRQHFLDLLARAQSIELLIAENRVGTYAVSDARDAMDQLRRCAAREYDPPQTAGLDSYISTDDYPAEALRRGEQGTVRFRVDISPHGRVASCAITSSSGSLSLDEAPCRIARERLSFIPATDERGNAVSESKEFSVTWRLPSERG